ncbi:MAG TPA: type II and III secretion system protein, partial [Phycisphaerales bacterium]|nr:type II and III secretion system protein [Phycisphaerales bacterium]
EQVLVEATILSAKLTEDFEMGIDLNFAAGASITKATAANWAQGGQNGTPIDIGGFASKADTGLKVGITTGDVSLFITALETITDVTVLANPKILAINKQLGQVYIGKKLGYREGDVETSGGGVQQGAVKFLETGTKLSFRPYIANDGYIRMDIYPKDSTGELNAQGVPDETSAELLTNIIVKDGETIVIGGLFRDKISNTRNQVPLLGDIPFVGEAFRKTDDVTNRDEVIILLTPHIVNDPAEVEGLARAEDVKRKRAGARQRLNWLTTTRLAEDSYARAVALFSKGDSHGALDELNWALHLRPTYLEAIRLRERIVQYRGGAGDDVIERIMIDAIEAEDQKMWNRF